MLLLNPDQKAERTGETVEEVILFFELLRSHEDDANQVCFLLFLITPQLCLFDFYPANTLLP